MVKFCASSKEEYIRQIEGFVVDLSHFTFFFATICLLSVVSKQQLKQVLF